MGITELHASLMSRLSALGASVLDNGTVAPASYPAIVVEPLSTELGSVDFGTFPKGHVFRVSVIETILNHSGSIPDARAEACGLMDDVLGLLEAQSDDVELSERFLDYEPVTIARCEYKGIAKSSQLRVGERECQKQNIQN